MLALDRDGLADLFTVRHDRRRQHDLHAEFILELGTQNIQMDVARTRNRMLLGFRIELGFERRILVVQVGQAGGDFSSAPLTLGWMPCV